ncbi:UNVERIFIED_CONTAM: hypothetical protein K2H54_048425 [Gekko kuhli]
MDSSGGSKGCMEQLGTFIRTRKGIFLTTEIEGIRIRSQAHNSGRIGRGPLNAERRGLSEEIPRTAQSRKEKGIPFARPKDKVWRHLLNSSKASLGWCAFARLAE